MSIAPDFITKYEDPRFMDAGRLSTSHVGGSTECLSLTPESYVDIDADLHGEVAGLEARSIFVGRKLLISIGTKIYTTDVTIPRYRGVTSIDAPL